MEMILNNNFSQSQLSHVDKSEIDLICFLEVSQANCYSAFTKIGIYQLELRLIVENWNCMNRKEVGLASVLHTLRLFIFC